MPGLVRWSTKLLENFVRNSAPYFIDDYYQNHTYPQFSLVTVDEKIFCCHGGLSPDLQAMEQIRRIMRPTDVPDQGLLCDLLWSDPDKDTAGWGENDRGVSFTFGTEVSMLSQFTLGKAHSVLFDSDSIIAETILIVQLIQTFYSFTNTMYITHLISASYLPK